MQDVKEEIRSRLNIEDVIGEYVALRRAGRNFKGLSPFSSEKTPSFVVSPDKQIWHDFSSGRGGDVFSFVMEVEGVDFREALELLARKAGVEVPHYDSGNNKERTAHTKRLYEVLDLAATYYQRSLIQNPHAVDYVFKVRGLSKEIVQSFRIGYAPSASDALVQALVKKGYTRDEIKQAGLTNQYGGDLFRGRMMVPLMDPSGRVIGFTARILTDEPNAPKYLNTPQTELYDKSRHVFGLSQAKNTIRQENYAVIVEGNLDVVSSHQAGVTGVVATAGTALTEPHLRALKRLTGDVRLAFDGDKAGLAATERAIPIADAVGVELTIVSLPEGVKDPDELIKRDGPSAWQTAIDGKTPVVDWVIGQYAGGYDLNAASGKVHFTDDVLGVVRLIGDDIKRRHYLQKIADMTGGIAANLQQRMDNLGATQQTVELKPVKTMGGSVYDEFSYQDNLLAVLVTDTAARSLLESFEPSQLESEPRQAVARYLKQSVKRLDDTPPELQNNDTYVKILLLKADARYADWTDAERYQEAARLLRQVIIEHQKVKKDELTTQLRDAETIGDETTADMLRAQINQLIKEASL